MSNSKTQAVKAPQQNAAQEQARSVYDVKIQAVYPNGGDIIADASATYNGVFAIRGLKLAKDENGPYVAMPGYQSVKGFVEVCTPTGPDVYDQLKNAVLSAYRQSLALMREQGVGTAQEQNPSEREQIPTPVAVKITALRNGPTLADATVEIGGAFTVSGTRIVNSENGLFVSMPSIKTDSGYMDACFPCTSEFHEKVKGAVLDGYQQALTQLYDQTAADAPEQTQGSAPAMGMTQTM